MTINSPLFKFKNYLIKRIFDLLIASMLLLILFPLIYVIVGTLIKLHTGEQVFFKQERVGLKNRIFIIYKFRTMINNNVIPNFGYFVRKYYVDELPQLINVIKGEMSIVGPRPHEVFEDKQFRQLLNDYSKRYLILPGITGWAQVNGFKGEIENDYMIKKRLEYDLWYINNWSLWMDIKIIFMTILLVIRGK